MLVGPKQLEQRLAEVAQGVRDRRAGIYGPGSVSWRLNRESIVFLAGGRAALLQLAHPFVAHAIAAHSQAPDEPLLRFQRTFDRVFAMVFGDLDAATQAARRVHRIHCSISGDLPPQLARYFRQPRYEANQPEALFWVHATLVESALDAYELVIGKLPREDKENYYRESKTFARLFGIPDDVMPADFAEFQRYCEEQTATLPLAPEAVHIAQKLLRPPAIQPAGLAFWYRTMTTALLPARMRQGFDLPWGRRQKALFHASLPGLRRGYSALPKRLRYLPAYHRALSRLAGHDQVDPVADWWERKVLRAPLGGAKRVAPSRGEPTRPPVIVKRQREENC